MDAVAVLAPAGAGIMELLVLVAALAELVSTFSLLVATLVTLPAEAAAGLLDIMAQAGLVAQQQIALTPVMVTVRSVAAEAVVVAQCRTVSTT
jgi:hypothetical protein